ncbi:outer membrane lipoprotein chaperone LolA [Haliea sp. E17]|uniref:outer membrane lipoprotein chaperone LolA n=1 Tax=Haliea sp. E17 TaxID=3401576 RepID=UPI003AAB236A
MRRFLLLGALTLCLVIGVARSEEDATAQLAQQLTAISQLSGHFSQSQRGAGAEGELTYASGSFRLLRPSYFAWIISAPDDQEIIADGDTLWHYDRDLETVTRRPLGGAQMQSPLQVLSGDYQALRRDYEVTATGQGRFQLVPKSAQPAFRELTLVFSDGTLGGMEILDNLGQLLLIEFTDLDRNPGLTPADFVFKVPEDADFFDYAQ